MDLKIQDIIKRPVVTSKSIDLYRKLGKYTFEVHKSANKLMVGDAVEKLWNVKVDKVCIMNVAGKNKTFSRKSFVTSDKKKAIITLKKGYKIEIPGLFETVASETHQASQKAEAEGR